MLNWPNNPIADKIRDAILSIKRITISMPDTSTPQGAMMEIMYDAGMSIRDPRMDQQGVKVTGWSRAATTYIYLPIYATPEQIQEWISALGWAIGSGYMYRWHFAPGRPLKHLWGMERYSINGMDTALGDSAPDFAEMTVEHGCWSWEINCAWRKAEGHTALLFTKWKEHDPTLTDDGTRSGDFPGWAGEHPWLRATEPNAGYESRYYFCKPEKYNKNRDVLVRGSDTK